jgi:hypothetical protein
MVSGIAENISVHDVVFRDLLQSAIWARECQGCAFYNNDISDIGCHKVDTPCSATWHAAFEDADAIGCDAGGGACVSKVCVGGNRDTLSCCTNDICSPPDFSEPQPDRRANGFGIIILNNSNSVTSRDNVATLVTKETFEVFRHNTVSDKPFNVRWFNNTATNSSGSFTAVGCDYNAGNETCLTGPTDVHWIGNTVNGTGLTGVTSGWSGFSASFHSHDLLFRDNVVSNAIGSGFNLAAYKDVRLEGNTTNNSCSTGVYTGQNEVQIAPTPGADNPYRPSNISVYDHTVTTTTQCASALEVSGADSIVVVGGDWNDLNSPGFDVNDSTDVVFRLSQLDGPGSGIGIDADDGGVSTTGLVQTGMNDVDCGSGGCITNFTTRVDNAGASSFIICTGTGVPNAICE